MAIIGLGSTPGSNLQSKLIKRFGSEQNMLNLLSTTAIDLNQSPEIKSKTALFFDLTAEPSRELYNIIFTQGNLRGDPLGSNYIINEWIERNAGLRLNIHPAIFQKIYVFMVNTLWFKDTWVDKFNPEHTELQPFLEGKLKRSLLCIDQVLLMCMNIIKN